MCLIRSLIIFTHCLFSYSEYMCRFTFSECRNQIKESQHLYKCLYVSTFLCLLFQLNLVHLKCIVQVQTVTDKHYCWGGGRDLLSTSLQIASEIGFLQSEMKSIHFLLLLNLLGWRFNQILPSGGKTRS